MAKFRTFLYRVLRLKEPCFNCGKRHIVPNKPESYGDCHG